MKSRFQFNHTSRESVSPSIFKGLLACALLGLASCGPGSDSSGTGGSNKATGFVEEPPKGPATIAEAAKVLDLNTFPVMDGVQGEYGTQPTLANLGYRVTSDVKSAYEFQRKQLTAQHWTELPGSSVTNEYASGVFTRNTFVVSVTISPDKSGLVDVAIHNHGNANLPKLPLPPGLKAVYAGPVTAIYETSAPVAETAKACSDLLLKAGWEPHGSVGDSSYFRQNAVRLNVTVGAAPAQGGKTMINLMSELMSAELPAPPDAQDVRYSDRLRRLNFVTTADNAALFGFYNTALAKSGWKANQEQPIHNEERDEVVYRNGDGVLFVYAMKGQAGTRNIEVSYTTLKEMHEQTELLKKKMAADKEKAAAEAK